jgi:cation diffusion facilitator CzcD-associated flavoprotein CzcO
MLACQNKTVGGVWSKENIYPGLKTNNIRGGIDFSDFPMHDGFGVPAGQHVSGEAMHRYISAYAEQFDLLRLIDFESHVTEISKLQGVHGWNVKLRAGTDIQTRKLVIATGVTNVPNRPQLNGTEEFGGPIMHSGELGMQGKALTDDSKVETIAVLGGGKSAYDAVHLAGKAGKNVEWIIRKSGKGPEWIFPAHTMGPLQAVREKLPARRIVSFFSPSLFNDGFGWIRHFLHFTRVGKAISQKFWVNLHQATLQDCGMLKDERTKVLEPEQSPFWYGTASGIYSFEKDIYEMVKTGQVRVHREDVYQLSDNAITFKSGLSIKADALVTATGFSAKPTLKFLPSTSHSDLGIPSSDYTTSQHQFWDALNAKADAKIGDSFPRLLAGPFRSPTSSEVQPFNPGMDKEANYTPFRLYRAVAPPGLTKAGDNSLAFVSMFSNLANTPRMELQCLWAYAYLNDALSQRPDPETVFDETALLAQYAKHRAPYGHGRFFPDLVFDQVPYMDSLLQDLGLPYWRKGNIFAELFSPYMGPDYRGVVQEWLRANRGEQRAAANGGEVKAVVDVEREPLLKVNGKAH